MWVHSLHFQFIQDMLPYHPTLCSLFKKMQRNNIKTQKNTMISILCWVSMPEHKACPGEWLIYIASLCDNWSLIPAAVSCKQLYGLEILCAYLFCSVLCICVACICLHFISNLTISLSSYEHQSNWIWKILISWSCPSRLDFTVFLTPILYRFLSFDDKDVIKLLHLWLIILSFSACFSSGSLW